MKRSVIEVHGVLKKSEVFGVAGKCLVLDVNGNSCIPTKVR